MGTPIYELISSAAILLEKSGGAYLVTDTVDEECYLQGRLITLMRPYEQGSMVSVITIPDMTEHIIYAGTKVQPLSHFHSNIKA